MNINPQLYFAWSKIEPATLNCNEKVDFDHFKLNIWVWTLKSEVFETTYVVNILLTRFCRNIIKGYTSKWLFDVCLIMNIYHINVLWEICISFPLPAAGADFFGFFLRPVIFEKKACLRGYALLCKNCPEVPGMHPTLRWKER